MVEIREINEFLHSLEVNDMSAKTVKTYGNQLQWFCEDNHITSIDQIVKLEPKFFEAYNEQMKAAGLSSATRRIRLVSVKNLYKWLIKHEYMEENPMKEQVKVKPVRKQEYLTQDEMNVFITACRNDKQRALFTMMFDTGMRYSEVVNIKIKDITEQIYEDTGEHFYVIDILGKGDKHRLIGVSARCMYLVQQYLKNEHPDPRPDNYLFVTKENTKIADTVMNTMIKGIARRAGLEEKANLIHVHSTRHSFASKQIDNGCPIARLSGMLGHSSISTTEKYIHSNQRENARYMAQTESINVFTRDNEKETFSMKSLPSITEIIENRKKELNNNNA
jgi:integrase/recombinase XerD